MITQKCSTSTICDGAFYNCFNLNQVVIGNGVSEIGKDAFAGCSNLTIVCNQGSYAESYAASNGIKYVYADGTAPTAAAVEKFPEGDQLLVNENAELLAGIPNAVDNPDTTQISVETELAQTLGEESQAKQDTSQRTNSESIVYTPQTGVDIPYVQVLSILVLAFMGMYLCAPKKKNKILA